LKNLQALVITITLVIIEQEIATTSISSQVNGSQLLKSSKVNRQSLDLVSRQINPPDTEWKEILVNVCDFIAVGRKSVKIVEFWQKRWFIQARELVARQLKKHEKPKVIERVAGYRFNLIVMQVEVDEVDGYGGKAKAMQIFEFRVVNRKVLDGGEKCAEICWRWKILKLFFEMNFEIIFALNFGMISKLTEHVFWQVVGMNFDMRPQSYLVALLISAQWRDFCYVSTANVWLNFFAQIARQNRIARRLQALELDIGFRELSEVHHERCHENHWHKQQHEMLPWKRAHLAVFLIRMSRTRRCELVVAFDE
jgi:hypothetical protein